MPARGNGSWRRRGGIAAGRLLTAEVVAPVDLVPWGVAPPPPPLLPLVAPQLLLSREEVQRELVDVQNVDHAPLVREELLWQWRKVPVRDGREDRDGQTQVQRRAEFVQSGANLMRFFDCRPEIETKAA